MCVRVLVPCTPSRPSARVVASTSTCKTRNKSVSSACGQLQRAGPALLLMVHSPKCS